MSSSRHLSLIEQTVDINFQSLLRSINGSIPKFIFVNKLHRAAVFLNVSEMISNSFWKALVHSCQCCISFAEGCMMGGLDPNKFLCLAIPRLDRVHLEKKHDFTYHGEIHTTPVPDQI